MGAKALRNYTTEELKAELRRRYEAQKAERDAVPRCRRCAYWGTVDHFGKPAKLPARVPSTAGCPMQRWGKENWPRFMDGSRPACEHFKKKDNTTINTENNGGADKNGSGQL